jgi:hypothetical protein
MLRLSTGLRNKLLGIETNKITNGEFTTVTTGWTAVDGVLSSEAGGQSGNYLKVLANSANVSKAYQDVTTMKIGHYYILFVYGKNTGASSGSKIFIGTVADEDAIFESADVAPADWTLYHADVLVAVVFEATATTHRFTLQNSDTTNTGKYFGFDTVKLVSLSRAVKDIFYKGFLNIYSGGQPATGDLAPTGNILVTMYSDGAAVGLSFDDAASGTLNKKSTETWSGTAVGAGTQTAGWFRLITPGDGGAGSDTDERLDGAIGTAGQELNMSSTSITNGAVVAISTFQLTLPAA